MRRIEVVADEPRFGMLETVREDALERLDASGEAAAIRERHAAWYLTLAEAAAPDLQAVRGYGPWLLRLDAELGNLRAALGWFDETGARTEQLRLLGAIEEYWTARPYHAEVRRWLEPGLRAAPNAPGAVRAAALSLAVYAAGFLGDGATAVVHAEAGLAVARTLHDPFALGRALLAAGSAWSFAGDVVRAASAYGEAVPLLREAGATSLAATALAELGDDRLLAGDVTGAVSLLDEALALHREIGYPWGVAITLGQRAHAARIQGDHALAGRLFAESITAGREIGTDRIVLGAVAGLAGVALDLGQPALAARLVGAVETAREATGAGRIAHARQAARLAAEARAQLGEAAFATAWEMGRGVPFAQAVADALAVASATAAKEPAANPEADAGSRFGLTPRERDVLRLLVAGKTDREIADALFVSRRTVTTHTSSIFAKLGVAGRAEAAALAVRAGLA